MSITGCCFSPSAKVLITSSVDSEGRNSSRFRLFLDHDIISIFRQH